MNLLLDQDPSVGKEVKQAGRSWSPSQRQERVESGGISDLKCRRGEQTKHLRQARQG